jgi:ribosome-binding ATPase YchF (GTP1/OBG family)
MSDYDYESDYNEMEDVPFVQIELDIRDCHQIYKALDHHKNTAEFSDKYDEQRTESMKDFFYRMILEYKFQVGE